MGIIINSIGVTMFNGCNFSKALNCANLLRLNNEEDANKQFSTLSQEVQGKISGYLSESFSKANNIESDKASILGQYTCTLEEKAQAIEAFLGPSVLSAIDKENRDALMQQGLQRPSLAFKNSSASTPEVKSYEEIWANSVIGICLIVTLFLLPLGLYYILNALEGLERMTSNSANSSSTLTTHSSLIKNDYPNCKRQVGIAHAQGKSKQMEDEHLVEQISFKAGHSHVQAEIYGIFDGHGGKDVSLFAQHNLSSHLKNSLELFNRGTLSDEGIFAAIKEAFVSLDCACEKDRLTGGSTATVAIILNDHIWVANIGDSRTVLNNGGSAIQLSEDQKCDNEKYTKGVLARKGKIGVGSDRKTLRVMVNNCGVAVPRAIGDHKYVGENGQCCIVHTPKITKYSLEDIKENSALILACDGIWDVCSTKQAVAFENKNHDKSPDIVAKELITKAYNAGSGDNLSAMVVRIEKNKSSQK